MKSFAKIIFILYLLILSWLVLFKFSYDIVSVMTTLHMQSVNLIPFSGNIWREMLENVIVFIPFGLLLSVNFKHVLFWRKLAVVFIFSFAVEITQFILAIGRTDITDIITNTAGGLIGLGLYELCKKYIDDKKLDKLITIAITLLLAIVILLRTFVRVKY